MDKTELGIHIRSLQDGWEPTKDSHTWPDYCANSIIKNPQAHIDALVRAGVLTDGGVTNGGWYRISPTPKTKAQLAAELAGTICRFRDSGNINEWRYASRLAKEWEDAPSD